MQNVLIGLSVAAVALAAGIQTAAAQTNYPFGKRPYCWSGDRSSGMPMCAFNTWQQCQAYIQGGGQHCFENPTIAWERAHGISQKQRQPKRQKSRRSY